MAFVDRIHWHGLYGGANAALSVPGPYRDTISYARLSQFIGNVGQRLAACGVRPGSTHGLYIKDNLLHIVATFALEQLGAASVALTDQRLASVLPLSTVIADEDLPQCPCEVIRIDLDWLARGSDPVKPAPRHKPAPDDICRIILTSGSTGTPKAAALTHRMIEERLTSYNHVFGGAFPHHQRVSCCMGFASSLGYLFCVHTLAKGGMYCIPDPSIDRTIRNYGIYGVQSVIAAPATLAEFWAMARAERKAFQSVELVLTAGSALSASLAEEIRENMCNQVISFYGTTETGVIASAPVETLNLDRGEVGIVVPEIEVGIADLKSGFRTVEGDGRVRIRGTANAAGYMGDDVASASFFEDGWFYPGDLGSLSAGGVLAIRGRENNVVNLGGIKTTIEAIEGQFSAAPHVADFGAVIVPDGLGIDRVVAVVVPRDGWSEDAFRGYCRSSVERAYQPIDIRVQPEIPRTANGKIDRPRLRQLVA